MLSFDRDNLCFLQNGSPITLTESERAEMRSYHWWQIIPFNTEDRSPGYFDSVKLLEKFFFHTIKLEGVSVLGIGCFEGFHLYMAEALGASRVVGITDEFGYYPSIKSSREFTHKKLNSKVEFLDLPFDELTPDLIGTFDVVLFFDSLPHSYNPRAALKRALALTNNAFLITTPITVETGTACHPLTNYDGTGAERNCSAFTRDWVKKSLEDSGFSNGMIKVWEHDYLTGCVIKNAPPPAIQSCPIEELPSDEGMESRTAVLVMSCQKYSQVWSPFFTLFKKYWPDCPYKVYLGTDTGTYTGVETIAVGQDLHWASNVLHITEKIDADRIILFQEDFLLTHFVNTNIVRRLIRHSFDQNIGSIRMFWHPATTGKWMYTDYLGTVGPFDDFRFSFQLTIWNKEFYRSLMNPGENPWTTEFVAARRAVLADMPFLSTKITAPPPIPYLDYAIDKGEWSESAFELLRKEGISLEGLTKQIRKPVEQ